MASLWNQITNSSLFRGSSSMSYQSAVDTVSQWRAKPEKELIFDSSDREISQYLGAVDKIQQSPNARGSDQLLADAKALLEREFQHVLSRITDRTVGASTVTERSSILDSSVCSIKFGDYSTYKAPHVKEILYLKTIAERMNFWGHLAGCVRVYKNVRKKSLHSELNHLRFNELNSGGSNRSLGWEELKVKLEDWVRVSQICVEILFEREKKLSEDIFSQANDECFVGTFHEFVVTLFSFVKQVSVGKRSYERMAPVLALYDAFSKVLEAKAAILGSEAGRSIQNLCQETESLVEDHLKGMLYDFESAVANDTRDPGDRGAIHGLTEYVMDQIVLLGRNEKLLKNLIKSPPSINFDSEFVSEDDLGDAHLQAFPDRHLVLIIIVLLKNLQGKPKSRDNPILANLFLMNNVHFLVQKIETSTELQTMIGDVFLNKLRVSVQGAKASYLKTFSDQFLTCFRDEGLYVEWWFLGIRLSKSALKRRMDAFNKVYTETQSIHSRWTIPDPPLRNDVRSSLSNVLVPAYERFLGKFRERVKSESSRRNYIKHSAVDLRDLVSAQMFAHS